MARIVILGAGVGGTLVANRLARAGRNLDITVVSGHGDHLYQPGMLHVPFGGDGDRLSRDERSLLRPGVKFRVEHAVELLPDERRVAVESGASLEYDWLVIATGSRLDHDRIPGAREGNHHFHCLKGAHRLATRLAEFRGGRIVVGACRLPYKCPPSPLEFAFLLDEWLRKRRLREATRLTFAYPLAEVSPLPVVAKWAESALLDRGIGIVTGFEPDRIDTAGNRILAGGRSVECDLAILVPPHVGAPFLQSSGLTDADGWVPADPATLKVRERIFALGDAASLPRPKSGSAAAFQSKIVAENILAEVEGRAAASRYDGHVSCFLETGNRRAAVIDFTYARPPRTPSPSLLGFWKKRLFKKLYFPIVRMA
jgi:sulfide:quinone oxidoreductase